MARKGNIAYELSEPGTGPAPVFLDPNEDKAIKNGWRRDTPPIAYPAVWPPPDPPEGQG